MKWKPESIEKRSASKRKFTERKYKGAIEKIFELKELGLNFNHIAEHLNECGYPTPNGKPWYRQLAYVLYNSRLDALGDRL
jgi:hypothetical protein